MWSISMPDFWFKRPHTISCDITWNTKNIGVNEGKNQLYLYLGTPPSPCWVWLLWSFLSGYEMPLQEGLHFEKRMFHSTFALVSPLLSYRTDWFHLITEANSNGQWDEKLSRWNNRMNCIILGGCSVKFPHFRLQVSSINESNWIILKLRNRDWKRGTSSLEKLCCATLRR